MKAVITNLRDCRVYIENCQGKQPDIVERELDLYVRGYRLEGLYTDAEFTDARRLRAELEAQSYQPNS